MFGVGEAAKRHDILVSIIVTFFLFLLAKMIVLVRLHSATTPSSIINKTLKRTSTGKGHFYLNFQKVIVYIRANYSQLHICIYIYFFR
jgi:hypothetical protein